MKAIQLISPTIPVLKKSDTGAQALQLMTYFHLQHLPVADDKEFIGLISEETILDHKKNEDELGTYDYSESKFSVSENQHVLELLKVAYENKLSLIPVVNADQHYTGSVSLLSLLHFFAKETDIFGPGGIIVLDISHKDFSLAEIARIIESDHAKVICVFTGKIKNSDIVTVTLKLNVEDLQPVIQSLERHDYTITEYFQEKEYFDNLKDRFDSLMNYLNV